MSKNFHKIFIIYTSVCKYSQLALHSLSFLSSADSTRSRWCNLPCRYHCSWSQCCASVGHFPKMPLFFHFTPRASGARVHQTYVACINTDQPVVVSYPCFLKWARVLFILQSITVDIFSLEELPLSCPQMFPAYFQGNLTLSPISNAWG